MKVVCCKVLLIIQVLLTTPFTRAIVERVLVELTVSKQTKQINCQEKLENRLRVGKVNTEKLNPNPYIQEQI